MSLGRIGHRVRCPRCARQFASHTSFALHLRFHPGHATEAEAFWAKLRHDDPPSTCWLWTGMTNKDGYGALRNDQGHFLAHRWAWTLTNGPIPAGLHALHKCNTPPCCNPAHLYLGTDVENAADRVRAGNHTWGEKNRRAVLTEQDVLALRAAYWCKGRKSNIDDLCAKHPHASKGTIYRAATGRSWPHLNK